MQRLALEIHQNNSLLWQQRFCIGKQSIDWEKLRHMNFKRIFWYSKHQIWNLKLVKRELSSDNYNAFMTLLIDPSTAYN